MYNGIFTACDMDGKILNGKDRGAVAKKEFIHIVGSVAYEYWDTDYDKRQHIYVTRDKNDTVDFCDEKCFMEWIKAKVEVIQVSRERKLKENASEDWMRGKME